MIGILSKNAVEVDIVELDKSDACYEKDMLPEDGLYR